MTPNLQLEEEYIIDESAELSIGERPGWIAKLAEAFPALQSRNYQLYFYGQLVSLIGTWLQIVAQGWLVFQLTNSAFLIGLVAAVSTFPSLVFSLFGGVIVDRYPKKYILQFTQFASMVLAFILGILTVLKVINVFEIAVLAFLLGVVTAVDTPARQAFAVELVEKDQLASAIALNAGMFNAARVIGPSVAGFLIAFIGTGGAFILNGVSYIAVIIALLYIRVPIVWKKSSIRTMHAIGEGIKYSYSHPIIRTLLIFTGVVSIFGWSYTTIMPLIASNTFHLDATGLGYLYAASGLGSLVATFLISAYSKKINALVFILGGNMLFAVSLIFFTLTHNVPLALIFLFFSGIGLIAQFSMMNTMLQDMVEDHVRGRVMSIYALMFLGLSPLGNLEIGLLAEKFGTGVAIQVGAVVVLLFGVLVFVRRNNIRDAHDRYTAEKMAQKLLWTCTFVSRPAAFLLGRRKSYRLGKTV